MLSDVACNRPPARSWLAICRWPVEQRRQPTHDEERGEEERDTHESRAAVEQVGDVELDPGRDEEERDENAEADRFELLAEEGVRHSLVPVDELERRAGEERSQNRLQAELGREDNEDC
jgi:hypothetical protein